MKPASAPRLAAAADQVDVAIVGAGAAGIAAARSCLAGGLTVAVLEARPRIGGRAVTTLLGGHAVDLGAHWLHAGLLNPLVRLGLARGEPLRRASRSSHLVVRGRFASAQERAEHGGGFERMERAFAEALSHEQDRSLAEVLPLLGRWRGPVLATHALVSGRPLAEVSVQDYPSDEFGDNYFIAGGYGAYLARLARGLPVALDAPVSAIDRSGPGVVLETPRGPVTARAAIVTVPASVLQQGAIAFRPGLPAEAETALAGFLSGTYEHVVMNWPDAPFHGADRLAKLVGLRRNVGLLTRIDGAPFHYMELDHATMAGLPDRAATIRFARAMLVEQFGARAIGSLRALLATDWRRDPWSRGSWAVVPPGRHPIRAALHAPVDDRIWFAGEATSIGQWGTVGGAWEEGKRAARDVARGLGRAVPAEADRKAVSAPAETP